MYDVSSNRQRLISCLKQELELYDSRHFNLEMLCYVHGVSQHETEAHDGNRFATVKDLHQCGSTACAIGIWNTYNPQEQLKCIEFTEEVNNEQFSYHILHEWLGMSKDAASELFGFEFWWKRPLEGDRIHPKAVSLGHFIEALEITHEALLEEEATV